MNSSTGKLPFDRPTSLQEGQDAKIFGYHFLLAAEATAHSLGENVKLTRIEPKRYGRASGAR